MNACAPPQSFGLLSIGLGTLPLLMTDRYHPNDCAPCYARYAVPDFSTRAVLPSL